MTTILVLGSAASASVHSVLVSGTGFTCCSLVVQSASPRDERGFAISRRVEALREAEREAWFEVERLTPDIAALSRIAARFTPPPEWFNEEDVL